MLRTDHVPPTRSTHPQARRCPCGRQRAGHRGMPGCSPRSWPIVLVLAVCWPQAPTHAGILSPTDFSSLGTLNLTAGTYTIDTSGVPVLMDSLSNVVATGVTFNQGVPVGTPFFGFNPEVAVFTFDAIDIAAGVTITASGDRPLALLSQSNFMINSTTTNPTKIDGSGQVGSNAIGTLSPPGSTGLGGPGGPGGGKGGDGGEGAPPTSTKGFDGEGPGGGFGGFGGLGTRGNGAGFGGFGGGGFGGTVIDSSYGDLKEVLQAGSGGGGTGTDLFATKGAGGGGAGGAIELGAVGTLTVDGEINVNGGNPGGGGTTLAGGGSGGGVRIHAQTVTGTGDVFARGGGPNGGPGAGGGGRILVLNSDGSQPTNLTLDASTTTTFVGPTPGIIEFGLLPLPTQNLAAQLTTGSPETLSQTFNTTLDSNSAPFNLFDLTFDFQFLTTTGQLDVFLDSVLLATLMAPATLTGSFSTQTIQVDGSLFPGNSHVLDFTLDGPTGSIVQIDNVMFPGLANGTFQAGILGPWTSSGLGSTQLVVAGSNPPPSNVVPEPSSLMLALTGGISLLGLRRRRHRAGDDSTAI